MRTCKLHNEDLKRDKVKVRRGLPPGPPEGYFAAEASLFPHANSWILGGCVIDDEIDPEDDREDVYFCPQCRFAENTWFAGRKAEFFWISN